MQGSSYKNVHNALWGRVILDTMTLVYNLLKSFAQTKCCTPPEWPKSAMSNTFKAWSQVSEDSRYIYSMKVCCKMVNGEITITLCTD